jgi:succinoglycan biosynthesis protein ExoL
MHGSVEARDATEIPVVDGMTRGTGVAARDVENGALSFFCPDVTDASTLKRVQQFIDFGYSVTVFGFRRERYNTEFQPPWPNVPLGFTTDLKYWHRLSALLHAVPALFANRRTLASASIFYARNIDQLVLALLGRLIAFSRAPVAYEVLDIPAILMRRGLVPTFLRTIERLCLRRVTLLVLSSPGFHRNYFSAVQKYAGDWFLLENKLYPSPTRARPSTVKPGVARRPWVVGYYGLIRGEATVDLIARLAHRLKDRVIFRFGGVFTTVEQAKFETVLRRCPNVDYSGPYLPQQDLERLYRGVDFAWALDLEHTDHNSRWLMPCRFYEAGYYGVPCLAVHRFEVGNVIEKHRIGWTFDAPLEDSLVRFFERLTEEDYELIRARLSAVPSSMFVAREDVAELCGKLARSKPGPRLGRS